MAIFVVGTSERPNIIDASAIGAINVRVQSSAGVGVHYMSHTGIELGAWRPPRRHANDEKVSQGEKMALAHQHARESLEILKSAKPKAQQVVHDFAGFIAEPEAAPEVSSEEVSADTGASTEAETPRITR